MFELKGCLHLRGGYISKGGYPLQPKERAKGVIGAETTHGIVVREI